MSQINTIHLAELAALHWPIITSMPVAVVQRENEIFHVETTAGPHALRLHRPGYHSEAAINSELTWMVMLAGSGIVVPRPALANTGNHLVKVQGPKGEDRVFSLLSWLPGQPFGKSGTPLQHKGQKRTAIMAAIGANLAKLHKLSDAWKPPQGFQRPAWDYDGLLGETPFWGRFWESRFLTPEDRDMLVKMRLLCRDELAQFERGGIDQGLIHADLARENILVDGDHVSFIDFDDSGFGYRMFDLATAMVKNIHEPDYADLSHALLEGYQRERVLRNADLAALPLMLVLRSLTYIGWVDARLSEPGMADKARRFLADAKFLCGEFQVTLRA